MNFVFQMNSMFFNNKKLENVGHPKKRVRNGGNILL